MKLVEFQRWDDGLWFRLNGYGLAVQRNLPILFSERNGYRRVRRFGRWALEILTPRRP